MRRGDRKDRERFAVLSQRRLILAAIIVCAVAGAWVLVSDQSGTEGLKLGLGILMVAFGVHGLVFRRELVATIARVRSYLHLGPFLHAVMLALIASAGVLMVLGAIGSDR